MLSLSKFCVDKLLGGAAASAFSAFLCSTSEEVATKHPHLSSNHEDYVASLEEDIAARAEHEADE